MNDHREIGEPDDSDTHSADCSCFFCREGDPDGPNPPLPERTPARDASEDEAEYTARVEWGMRDDPDDLPSTADPGVVTDPKEE